MDLGACEKVKVECTQKLETKRSDFNNMKRDIADMESNENKVKEEMERLVKERNVCKDKCDRIK